MLKLQESFEQFCTLDHFDRVVEYRLTLPSIFHPWQLFLVQNEFISSNSEVWTDVTADYLEMITAFVRTKDGPYQKQKEEIG